MTITESIPGDDELLRKSALYQEFLAEREEILKHKWNRSKAEGHDIGFEHAFLDWVMHHRSKWLRSRRTQRNPIVPLRASGREAKRNHVFA